MQENVLEHDRYRDVVINGLPALPLSSDCVVWSRENERITVISQTSLREQCQRAEEVAKYARKDTPYQAEVLFGEMDVRVFLLHKDDRAVGLLLMEKRSDVWRAKWKDIDGGKQPTKLPNHPPIWSVCLVWVLKQHRRLGFAQTMLDKALVYLGCSLDNIGWYTSSSPPPFTPSGEAFVRSCCPDEFYIAK